MTEAALARFAADYSAHRAEEGRGYAGDALLALPYLRSGPLARQWQVRARSFEALMARIIRPLGKALARPLDVLDLGAGNGWLSYRLARDGHRTTALDIRDDAVDGLGAAVPLVTLADGRMTTMIAPFEAIPLPDASIDVAVFNAALHYAVDLRQVLGEAARVVRRGGRIVILDSPFYAREADGLAMVSAKHGEAGKQFGARADTLLALPFIEFLTRERLAAASPLVWTRHRVRYPLWYELRPLVAALRGKRRPSRFDLWVSVTP